LSNINWYLSRFNKEDVAGAAGKQKGRVQQQNGEVIRGIPEAKQSLLKGVSFMDVLGVGGRKGGELVDGNKTDYDRRLKT
jgi:hypothetical protein